jgi:dephospho-CoA kinase
MHIIGVTGGIGVGKTEVCKILESLGCAAFYADRVAKDLQETDAEVIAGIKKMFGESIYENGIPNRKKIAEVIFSDEPKRLELNALIHPKVFQRFDDAVEAAKKNHKPALVKEAAILVEVGAKQHLTAVIVVAADLAIRLQRLATRGLSESDARKRIDAQLPQQSLIAHADYVIWNNAALDALRHETERTLALILKQPTS